MNHKKNVLTIAGSDSSGGAGIQADIKTFEALNIYSASIITSVTAQNTQGVQQVFDLPDDIVSSQLNSVLSDINFSAVKIGMLKRQSYIEIVARKLQEHSPIIIVLDPVMISSSGHRLLDEDALLSLIKNIFPLASLITPNIPEAATLLGKNTEWIEANLKEACNQLIEKFSLTAVLLKGGHLTGNNCEDTLASVTQKNDNSTLKSSNSIQYHTYKYPKSLTNNTHGTGCTLASAITAFLAQDFPLETAVQYAGEFLQIALSTANLQNVGNGFGPLNHHAYNFRQLKSS
tara:strand:- start:1501 stop:2367 length:867 start_codon:yes stop_codon:yes gene_type:complete